MSRLFVKRLPTGSFLMLLLYIGLLLSAIAVAYSTYWNRQLLNSLYSGFERARQGAGRVGPVDSRAEHLDRP